MDSILNKMKIKQIKKKQNRIAYTLLIALNNSVNLALIGSKYGSVFSWSTKHILISALIAYSFCPFTGCNIFKILANKWLRIGSKSVLLILKNKNLNYWNLEICFKFFYKLSLFAGWVFKVSILSIAWHAYVCTTGTLLARNRIKFGKVLKMTSLGNFKIKYWKIIFN